MEDWRSNIDLTLPMWADYRSLLLQLPGPKFPSASELCKLLPSGLRSHGGSAIHFVAASELPEIQYENHIYTSGQVSTREESWHDLFNALVWSRFPQVKVAMNAVHFREQSAVQGTTRGKQRDALTLFDESGAILVSSDKDLLDALAMHEWNRVFQPENFSAAVDGRREKLSLVLCGHALLEKFLHPYKAITAQVLLVCLDEADIQQPRHLLLEQLDRWVAAELLEKRTLGTTDSLAALPLMGVPGWWPDGVQDSDFYMDQKVFRPLAAGRKKAPICPYQSAILPEKL